MFNIINHSTNQTFLALSKNNGKLNTSSFQTSLNETQKGGVILLRDEFRGKIYEKTLQNKAEFSQNEYERSIRFLLDTMQKLLENMDKNSSSYEIGERFYESFLGQLNPEQFVFLEINSNEFKPTSTKAQRSIFVEQYKEKSIWALRSDDNTGKYLSKLAKELARYEASLKQIALSAMTFFSIFESEIDDNLMQEIIAHLANVKAYNDYKAYNIDLQDGSKLSWQYINGGIKIAFIKLDANLTLENSNKILTEMKNFKILLEMFEQNSTTSHSKDGTTLLKELLNSADETNFLQGVRA